MAECVTEGSPYKIQTFVFLDLETLGFHEKPRILELSMIAVSREDLLSMKHQAHINNPFYNKGDPLPIPRVCHKYTMLYYPKKIIHPFIEQITGLNNYNLHHLNSFDKDSAESIKLFLDLPPPVCIVAHNGYGFDFPILNAEIMGVQEENLKGVLCIDSLRFLRHFEKTDIEKITEFAKEFLNEDDDFDMPSNSLVIENGVNGHSFLEPEKVKDISSSSDFNTPNMKIHIDFQTPEKLKIDDTNKTPPRPAKNGLPPLVKFTPSPKRAFPETNLHNTPSKAKKVLFQHNEPPIFPELKKKPFSQPHIFYRIFGQKHLAHRAESDAVALLQICAFHGLDFVTWADTNCTLFGLIKPRWYTTKTYVKE